MNPPSKIIVTAIKAALLSSTLIVLGVVYLENELNFIFLPIFFISTIITFIISVVMISITILPIDDLLPNLSSEQKFKRYFPYYAIVFFLISFSIVTLQNFEPYIITFFIIVYITAMQSFVWFFKVKNTKNKQDNS